MSPTPSYLMPYQSMGQCLFRRVCDFTRDQVTGCSTRWRKKEPRTQPAPVETQRTAFAVENLQANDKESATSIQESALELEVPLTICAEAAGRNTRRTEDFLAARQIHGSTTNQELPKNLRIQEAMEKFDHACMRFQEVTGNQIIARPLCSVASDDDPIGNIGNLAEELERYIMMFKKEWNAQMESRGRAERKNKVKKFCQKACPLVQNVVMIATGVAAVCSLLSFMLIVNKL
jgi:hypothetical protein